MEIGVKLGREWGGGGRECGGGEWGGGGGHKHHILNKYMAQVCLTVLVFSVASWVIFCNALSF